MSVPVRVQRQKRLRPGAFLPLHFRTVLYREDRYAVIPLVRICAGAVGDHRPYRNRLKQRLARINSSCAQLRRSTVRPLQTVAY